MLRRLDLWLSWHTGWGLAATAVLWPLCVLALWGLSEALLWALA